MLKTTLLALAAFLIVSTADGIEAEPLETSVESGTALVVQETVLRKDDGDLELIPEGSVVWVTGIYKTRVCIEWNGVCGQVSGNSLEHFDRQGVARDECKVWDLEGNLLGEIPEGTLVKILDPDGSNRYISVEWQGQECYVQTDDLARSFVHVGKEKQRLELFLNGYLFYTCPTVTGAFGTDKETPEGCFKILECYHIYYMRGRVIRYCEYAFRFYEGYFIHDADAWRSIYGGDEWITNGSSGCVNVPRVSSAVLYKWLYEGMYVIITS